MGESLAQKIGAFIEKADQGYSVLISFLLVSCTLLVLFLSVLVIILRWFETTLVWYDPFVRHLVFILAFLGGVKATRMGSHISIDLLGRSLKNSKHRLVALSHYVFISAASLAILSWLINAGYRFYEVEVAYGRPGFFNLHSSYLVAIIPVGFTLIALQFLFDILLAMLGRKDISSTGGGV